MPFDTAGESVSFYSVLTMFVVLLLSVFPHRADKLENAFATAKIESTTVEMLVHCPAN